jgi:hypothetical protein
VRRRHAAWALCTFFLVNCLVAWVSFTKAEAIDPRSVSPLWRLLARILAFPLLYFDLFVAGKDLLIPAAVLNCLLWGLLETGVLAALAGVWRRRRG